MKKITRALISVSDKKGVTELAKILTENDVEIISTGGTAKTLEQAGIQVLPIQDVTGNPEAFGGRMKTISFQVGSGLLFRRDNPEDIEDAQRLGIRPIDLVVCNLYPFEDVVKKNGSDEELIENIDIGGPTIIRAAAKNFQSVCILTNPEQYEEFTQEFQNNSGAVELKTRKTFATKAFALTAQYDALIFDELIKREGKQSLNSFVSWERGEEIRYGENPHQKSVVMPISNIQGESIGQAVPLQGKKLSYNNLFDADAAWKCTSEISQIFPDKSVVTVVKHANPCGIAVSENPQVALEEAWACDPISAFGSIICFSEEVNQNNAEWLSEKFIEIIIAPSFSEEAKNIFSKKKNLRLISCSLKRESAKEITLKSVSGAVVFQQEDESLDTEFKEVTKAQFNKEQEELLKFGVSACKYLKSNGVALVGRKKDSLVLAGAGMGQPNRLESLSMLAVPRAKDRGFNIEELILISDAFFPFADSVRAAAQEGLKYIVQPGGSIRDKEVIEECDKQGMAMVFTGRRHFRH